MFLKRGGFSTVEVIQILLHTKIKLTGNVCLSSIFTQKGDKNVPQYQGCQLLASLKLPIIKITLYQLKLNTKIKFKGNVCTEVKQTFEQYNAKIHMCYGLGSVGVISNTQKVCLL